MSVYPNPSSEKLTIKANQKLDNSDSKDSFNVTISDEQGNKILSRHLDGKEMVIDKGLLKTGTYYVRIYLQGELMETKRILIE